MQHTDTKIVIEGSPFIEFQDGGQSMVAEVSTPESPVFVRIQSWDTDTVHNPLKRLVGDVPTVRRGVSVVGKRLRITIEAV